MKQNNKIEPKRLMAIVVWYNPTQNNVDALRTYINDVQSVIIVDNSAQDNSHLLKPFNENSIIYTPNYQNIGIASALTLACKLAHDMGATWVLTMDQDSCFKQGTVSQYIELANAYVESKVAIFAPLYNTHGKIPNTLPRYTSCDKVMTSGNLLSLDTFALLGNCFREDFFIDSVDDEYCYRAKRHNYDIIQINDIILTHALGDIVTAHCLGFTKQIHIHAPLRYYYIVRNTLKLADIYPEYSKLSQKTLRKILRKMFKRTLLYRYPQKWIRWHYVWQGWRDYKKGISGKYNR